MGAMMTFYEVIISVRLDFRRSAGVGGLESRILNAGDRIFFAVIILDVFILDFDAWIQTAGLASRICPLLRPHDFRQKKSRPGSCGE